MRDPPDPPSVTPRADVGRDAASVDIGRPATAARPRRCHRGDEPETASSEPRRNPLGIGAAIVEVVS